MAMSWKISSAIDVSPVSVSVWPAALEHLQDDCGGAQRDETSREDPARRVDAEEEEHGGDDHNRADNLYHPAPEHHRTEFAQAFAAQFQTDEEHQEDDSDLAQLLDEFDRVDPPERQRTDDGPCDEIPHDGDEAQTLGQVAEDGRCGQDNSELGDQRRRLGGRVREHRFASSIRARFAKRVKSGVSSSATHQIAGGVNLQDPRGVGDGPHPRPKSRHAGSAPRDLPGSSLIGRSAHTDPLRCTDADLDHRRDRVWRRRMSTAQGRTATDRHTGNPAFNPDAYGAEPAPGRTMTVGGAALKAIVFTAVVIAAAAAGWSSVTPDSSGAVVWPSWSWVGGTRRVHRGDDHRRPSPHSRRHGPRVLGAAGVDDGGDLRHL